MKVESRHDKAQQLQREKSDREGIVFILVFVVFILFGFGWQLVKKDYEFIGLCFILTSIAAGILGANQLLIAFALRDRIIKFKMNVDPLFVHTSADMVADYGNDSQVLAKRDYAIESLLLAGPDTDRVKVYTLIFRDLIYTAHWWEWPDDENGKPILRATRFHRKGTCVSESWEEFDAFLKEVMAEKIAESRRLLYRLNSVDDVQRKIYNQE